MHIPVLAREVLEYLIPETGECRVIDCTVGYGGHSSLILAKNRKAVLLGIDRDDEAIAAAEEVLKFAAGRFSLSRGNFSDLAELAAGKRWLSADVVLMDLGVSSPQIDSPRRGFSFKHDGPLDMRMDCHADRTASRFLNTAGVEDLEFAFREYGEIRESRRLARKIVERRNEKAWFGTLEFADFCNSVLGRQRRPGLQAATLCFQALRIAVNSELQELEKALPKAVELLRPGGRIAVISFHSLEDRIVKRYFVSEARDCICPPGLPVCCCGHKKILKIITRRPLEAGRDEVQENRRAGSAKMRVAEKI